MQSHAAALGPEATLARLDTPSGRCSPWDKDLALLAWGRGPTFSPLLCHQRESPHSRIYLSFPICKMKMRLNRIGCSSYARFLSWVKMFCGKNLNFPT